MRLTNLVLSEFRLLYKYGIIFLYGIFTIIYIALLTVIPSSAKPIVASILIFTDPAAMGLFFMGAMVLFEKSQRVESSLGVSPVKTSEYIVAKVIPFMAIGTLVGLALRLSANCSNIVLSLIGVALSSVMFSLCGLLVGTSIQSLNGFMIATVPFEIVICTPAILYNFKIIKNDWWIAHPGIAAIRLIGGDSNLWYLSFDSMIIWVLPIYFVCNKFVRKSFSTMGGAKI